MGVRGAIYLTRLAAQALRRRPVVRAVFNGLRWLVRAEAPWRRLPNDVPPWDAASQLTRRWLAAGQHRA